MSVKTSVIPQPYQVNSMGLVLTRRCNARCSHCCFECSPQCQEQMTSSQVLSYINQIAAAETINSIVVTGGEPFIDYDLLHTTIKAAGQNGLGGGVVSNCYWAISASQAREKLAPLVDSGLISISISYDEFHEKYIDQANVKYALETALAMGIEVAVSRVTLSEPPEDAKERLLKSLGLEKDVPMTVHHGHVHPAGRAKKKFSLDQMAMVDPNVKVGQRLKGVCGKVLRKPMIMINGDLAACCGTTIFNDGGIKKAFVVGNLNERPLVELLEDLELNPLFVALMIEGPWYLYLLLNKKNPYVFPRKRFVNICDLCAQVLCNEQAWEMLHEIIDQNELPLLVKKMMLEAARQEKTG